MHKSLRLCMLGRRDTAVFAGLQKVCKEPASQLQSASLPLVGPVLSHNSASCGTFCILQDNKGEDTDGEAASQADSFVVADGYLSESERMDLEDIAAAVGGKQPFCDAISLHDQTHVLQSSESAQAAFRLLWSNAELQIGCFMCLSFLKDNKLT